MSNVTRPLFLGLFLLAMVAGPLTGHAAAQDEPTPAADRSRAIQAARPGDAATDANDQPPAAGNAGGGEDANRPTDGAAGDSAAAPSALTSDEPINPAAEDADTDGGQPQPLETAANKPPVPAADAYIVRAGRTLIVDAASGVLANDSDPEGDPLGIQGFTSPSHGDLVFRFDGSFTYLPYSGFVGDDGFTYFVTDGVNPAVEAAVTVSVTNQAPIAVDDAFTVAQEATLTIAAPGLLANDSDPDGDPIGASDSTRALHGSLIGPAGDGSFTYTPLAGFSGTDSFAYRVEDGTELSNFATVTIEVTPINHPPVVGDLTFEATQGFPLVVSAPGVLFGALDEDGDPISVLLVGGPAHGTVDLAPDGGFTYTPDAGFVGDDSFTYQASDGVDTSPVATATIEVRTVPVGVADAYATAIDTPLTIDAANGVLANDLDPEGDPLTAVPLFDPTHGSLAFQADGSFTYTPEAGFVGFDSFLYQPTDGERFGQPVFVTITVGSAPVGAADAYATDRDTPLTVDAANGVLANDSDPNGLPLTALLQTDPPHGTVDAFAADGSFTYTPDLGFSGEDSFAYIPNNTGFAGGPIAVTITVNATNRSPVANDDGYTAAQDATLAVHAEIGLLANDTDADGDPLSALVASVPPAHGTLNASADGSFFYTPDAGFVGTDSFQYVASDGHGFAGLSNVATVTITVIPNQPPVAVDDNYTTPRDTPLAVNAAAGMLANDSDPDGDPLTIVVITVPQNGVIVFGSNGSINYTPDPGFTGEESFQYRASDGLVQSNLATVTIIVTSTNHAPIAAPDAYSAVKNKPLSVQAANGVLANDADADGDPTQAILVTQPTQGSVVLNADGSFVYTPKPGFVGSDTFTYVATDGADQSAPTTVTITVKPKN